MTTTNDTEASMHRTLIVAKITPGAEGEVASIWARSDQTELPGAAGVLRRQLFSLGDLYIHVLESERPSGQVLRSARAHEEFDRISAQLSSLISPYMPNWQSPADAVARCFYSWEAQRPDAYGGRTAS
jgi:cyclase